MGKLSTPPERRDKEFTCTPAAATANTRRNVANIVDICKLHNGIYEDDLICIFLNVIYTAMLYV